ncbi:serine/threonine protein kinase [Allosalinactinospora lopnorensis]|uniref:serine/threonine protein kinase n=1 Tax=Allosalinactinospora lopnorensis TaxID=1352348 RepID=UPI000623BAE0|nr:serine/threonine-protein kinase [Allosalinactinospora lopnorensis]
MGPLENGDPERIGRYRLIGRLGAGGMGQVFFGRSAGGRAVAIKRIHPHMATDASFRERFAREVTAARQVSGAFTAPVIDADTEGAMPWLVTSYVPSLPLDEAVRRFGPLPEHTLRVLATGLAEALSEIHRVGLIHRDLKPGNVLLAEDGPRVIDFGIARATEGTAATQSIIGTPGFMSPEQIQGERMTPTSDMFAYGAVLVYAASGAGPFGEGAMHTMVMRIMQHEPDISAVPPSLQQLAAACLTKDASRRPGPGPVLDALGDIPIGQSWLPPELIRGVQEQVNKVNSALSAAPGSGNTNPDGSASAIGGAAAGGIAGAAAGAAAGSVFNDQQATQQDGADATSMMGAYGEQNGHQSTAVYGQTGGQTPPTSMYGHGDQTGGQAQPTAAMPPSDGDEYGGLYRGSPEDQARQQREQRRREREEQRYREQQREEQRRRQEAERAHQERLRAEQQAARRAQAQARRAGQPGLWSFVKLLPLLIIPIVQIPLGWSASYAWQWFSATEMWNSPWYYEGILTESGFFHALYLGYFLLNNLVALEYVVRSARTGFVTGTVLGLMVIAGTNGALFYFGFFG